MSQEVISELDFSKLPPGSDFAQSVILNLRIGGQEIRVGCPNRQGTRLFRGNQVVAIDVDGQVGHGRHLGDGRNAVDHLRRGVGKAPVTGPEALTRCDRKEIGSERV